jgi:hypothetical protein
MICGRELTYAETAVKVKCYFCGVETESHIFCPEGHYVCDKCHQRDSLKVIEAVCASTTSTNPIEIAERIMEHPSVPMHGPEHHPLVPYVILTALRNEGYALPNNWINEVISRGTIIVGGCCGYCGDCGAGVGVGIAFSTVLNSTPLKSKERSLCIRATATALNTIATDGGVRCCKRATRTAIITACELIKEHLSITLPYSYPECIYTSRNKQCERERCRYYPKRYLCGDRDERWLG